MDKDVLKKRLMASCEAHLDKAVAARLFGCFRPPIPPHTLAPQNETPNLKI